MTVKPRRMGQKEAVCTAFGWDINDADEYQPGHTSDRYGLKVFNAGDGYAVAPRENQKIPKELVDQLGPWKMVERIAHRVVYVAGEV